MKKSAGLFRTKHYLVTGLPGSGKSSLSKRLAKKMKLPRYEIDKHPNFRRSMDLLDEGRKEEAYKMQRAMVQEALALKKPHVIEGQQLLLAPDLVKNHYVRIVDPPKSVVESQWAKREAKKHITKSSKTGIKTEGYYRDLYNTREYPFYSEGLRTVIDNNKMPEGLFSKLLYKMRRIFMNKDFMKVAGESMIFSDSVYLSYKEEVEKIASISAVFSKGVKGAKDLYSRALYNPVTMGLATAPPTLGGQIGGALKGTGQLLIESQKPTKLKNAAGNFLKSTSDVVGNAVEQVAYRKGGIVKKPTVARLAEDGDPEAVIPLGNDRADIKNRKRVIKKALKVIEKEKTAAKKDKKNKKNKEYDPKSAYGKFNKYFVPSLGSAVSGGTMGASLSAKGNRLKGFKRGAGGGIAGSLLWHATTRGYSKAMDIPYKEVVASVKKRK